MDWNDIIQYLLNPYSVDRFNTSYKIMKTNKSSENLIIN